MIKLFTSSIRIVVRGKLSDNNLSESEAHLQVSLAHTVDHFLLFVFRLVPWHPIASEHISLAMPRYIL